MMRISVRWALIPAAVALLSAPAQALDLKGAFERGLQQLERAIGQPDKDPGPAVPSGPSSEPRATQPTPPAGAASGGAASQKSGTTEQRRLVAETQALLNGLGYDAGPVDGLMGSRTRQAIAAFQRANGMAATGQPDDGLLATLRTAAASAEAASSITAGAVSSGASSPDPSAAAGSPSGTGPESHVPMAHHVLWLLSLREHPSLVADNLAAGIDESILESFAYSQIFTEQRIWDKIDKELSETGGNPAPPMLLYEWQNLVETDPAAARALVENLFVAKQPDWKFAEIAGALNPRVEYRQKQAFVFARDRIIGRDARFAVHELAPVLERHILEAASLVPQTVYLEVNLSRYRYDFDRMAFVLPASSESKPLGRPLGEVAFASDDEPDAGSSGGLILPDSMKTRALYAIDESMVPRLIRDRGADGPDSAHGHWRDYFSRLTAFRSYVLALDRVLVLDEIPVAAAEAERAALGGHLEGKLRVLIDVERVELGTRKVRGLDDKPAPVIVAAVNGVEVVTRAGDVLAILPPEHFASAAENVAAAEAAAEAEARALAEQAETEKRAQQAAEQRLAGLLGGRTGLVMLRRVETAEIETVYTGNSEAIGYTYIVKDNSLDLPAKPTVVTTKGMAEALRDERGAAIVVHASVFARDIFGLVPDLDLHVSSFPSEVEGPTPPQAGTVAKLAPDDSKYVLLRRRDDRVPLTRVVAQDGGAESGFYSSALREAAPWTRHLEELGASIAFELPEKAERVDLRGIPEVLRDQSGTAVVLPREGFESIFLKIADLDLVVRRFPPEEFHVGIPKDHTKDAKDFAILGISGGLDEAAALAASEKEFASNEIVRIEPGTVQASRGACDAAGLSAAGTQEQAGAYCLILRFRDGAVSQVVLRQVVQGDAEEAALKALRERYGRSPFMTEIRYLDRGGKRTVHGWGAPLSVERPALGRVDAKTPPTVMEAVVWVENGVTTIQLHLDDVSTLEEVKATQTPAIKF